MKGTLRMLWENCELEWGNKKQKVVSRNFSAYLWVPRKNYKQCFIQRTDKRNLMQNFLSVTLEEVLTTIVQKFERKMCFPLVSLQGLQSGVF